ncbi:MAG: 2-oxoacid:ferredoxin oxidoreductase subunit beta [Thermoprotei archaeon]|nr:MAG: 2-oxoacid:ferredoxin oxidoreductase subunit beta [Thermoprotei archaeon]RLF23749.1 MAG: 2-oxoacid:ferredoxin oxidoreductase subunit beta [Thermoprotei archaeon]
MRGKQHPLDDYIRYWMLPTIWCPGCGNGIVLQALARALKELGLRKEEVVLVCGIGCSGRMAMYLDVDTAHTLHGRAIPFAIGVKLAKPHLKVIVVGGDGDLMAIGCSHLIHAARRNVEITTIMINNGVYAMTGGQVAPTTPHGVKTTTTPYGNLEEPFNAVSLMATSGAVYVARWTVAHPIQLKESIKKAMLKEGFSFIEVISTCPTMYGKFIGLNDPASMIRHLKKISIIKSHVDPSKAIIDWNNLIVCGEFIDREREGFTRRIRRCVNEARGADRR